MANIVYKEKSDSYGMPQSITVYLEKRMVGMIKRTKTGWAYFPKGHEHGQIFDSIREVKNSLEAE